MRADYDVVIVGGGLVGASLACALGSEDLRIALIEATPFISTTQPSFDARTVALAHTSQQIFQALGLWPRIAELGAMPIRKIHVSDRGHSGLTHLDAAEAQVDAMGYVVETRVIGQVLTERLQHQNNLTQYCPARLHDVRFNPSCVELEIEQAHQRTTISSRLVVAADGGNSLVRQKAGVETYKLNYGQSAVIANVRMDTPHHHVAYERFTESGPLALLPTPHVEFPDRVFALVLTLWDKDVEGVMALSDADFLAHLQQRFGNRAGRFVQTGSRHVYPLSLLHAKEHVRQRLAFIGNAAHTLHPVAGQGFNLGLRDVAVLAQVLSEAARTKQDPGNLTLLREYARWRKGDQLQASLITDSLVRTFSSTLPPLALARNLGLWFVENCPPLKRRLMRHAMGYVGKLPRLARGLRL